MSDTERQVPVATTRRGVRMTPGRRNALIVLGVGCFVAFNFWKNNGPNEISDRPMPGDPTSIGATTVASMLGAAPPPDPAPPPATPPAGASAPMPGGASFGMGGGTPPPKKRMLSYAVETPSPAVDSRTGANASQGSGPAPGASPGRGGPTSVSFAGEQIVGRRAGPAIDQTMVLMPGLYSCTLDVAVSSERPGPFFCHTKRDIKSPLGLTLMETGTQIQGTTQSDIGQGQSRIVSLSAMAWTPAGVPVPLGGPMGDQQGAIGMTGKLDTHLAERLQGAVILMLTQGAFQMATAALQASVSRGGSNNSFFNLNSAGVESAVAQAVRNGGSIQNTVTLNQGDEVTFYVTAPISFADSYTLTPIGARR